MKQEEFDNIYHEWLNKEWFTGLHTMSEFMRMTAEHFYKLGQMEKSAAITSLHLCGVDVGKGESVTKYAVWDTHENTYPFSGTLEQCRKYIEEHDPMGIDMSVIP